MIRVMTVISNYYPIRGGAENVAMSIVNDSIGKGCAQKVLTIAYQKVIRLLGGNFNHRQEVSDKYIIYRFQLARMLGKEKNGPLLKYVTLLKFIYYLIKLKNDYDVIHAHTYYLSSVASIIAAKIIGKPVVITGHSTINRLQNQIQDKTVPSFYLSILKYSNYYVAINKHIAKEAYDVSSIPHSRIKVIYNGIDTHMFRPASSDEEKKEIRLQLNLPVDKILIIYHGRLHAQKNVQLLVESIDDIKEIYGQDLCLLVLGSGVMEPRLKKYVVESGMEDIVIFTGKINDVNRYLRASDIYCLPSFNEGFSISLLEAMGSGLVCIVSDIEGNRETVTDKFDGFFFNPYDIDTLTSVLTNVLEMIKNNNESQVKRNARKTVVEKYSISKMTDSYISLFRSSLNMQ